MSGLGGDEDKPPQWQQPQWKSGDPLNDPSPQEDRPSWQPQDQPSWQQPQQPSWQQPQEQPGWQQSQPQWGEQGAWQPGPQTPGSATAALILGICSIVVCWPLGVISVIYGNKAKNEIERSGGRLTGGGLAMTGIIGGWIGIALTVITLLIVIAAIAGS